MRHVKSFLSIILLSAVGAGRAHAQNAVPNEYIVKFKSQTGSQKLMSKLSSKVSMKAEFDNGMAHVAVNPQYNNTLSEIQNDPDVEFVEPNFILTKVGDSGHGGYSKNEVEAMAGGSGGSGGSASDPNNYVQSLAPTQTATAWPSMLAANVGTKPIVAIIDTGLDYNHETFTGSNALWNNSAEIPGNGIDDDFNGYVDDVSGWNFINNTPNYMDDDDHGTHVAGIVVGVGLNIFATPIAQSRVKVMALKFLDANGSGTTSNAIKAIYYAANMGAKVINNSWGGTAYSRSLHEAMTYAYSRGLIVVSAAGNAGSNNDSKPMYPANYDVPSNIAVAATDDYDQKASFSNYGNSVAIAAPGYAVWSSIPGNRYDFLSGTSMAAPFVSGLAAHAAREAPQLSGYQLKSILVAQVNTFSSLASKVASSGRVNVLKTINSAKAQVSVASWQPSYSPGLMQETSLASTDAGAAQKGAGCGTVTLVTAGGQSYNLFGGGGSGSSGTGAMGVCLALALAPLLYALALRRQIRMMDPVNRRKYARYKIDTDMELSLDGAHHLLGHVGTISLGGLSFSSSAHLENNQMITMRIKQNGVEVEIQGRIVWSKGDQTYGVQFSEITEGLRNMMRSLTPNLTPC